MRSLYFTVVKKKKKVFCAFNKSKKKRKKNERRRKLLRHQTFVHEELSKQGLYMYILSQDYHFDRQWKELERPNASFEGRTIHPIMRNIKNNTTANQTMNEKKIFAVQAFLFFFVFWYGRKKTFSHTRLLPR